MVQLMPLPPLAPVNPESFTFLVPAYPGCPGKRPLNRCSVVVWTVCVLSVDNAGCVPMAAAACGRFGGSGMPDADRADSRNCRKTGRPQVPVIPRECKA